MEIGSIFEINPLDIFKSPIECGGRYPFDKDEDFKFEYYNTGRAAIESLLVFLKAQGHSKVWMPSFNCSSVREAAERAGMEIKLFNVGRDLSFSLPEKVENGDIIYLVQYFGKVWDNSVYDNLDVVRSKGCVIIEDITLSIFSEKSGMVGVGDYLIGSIRKWLPITDGGFIASRKGLPNVTKSFAANDYTLYYFAAQVMKNEYLHNIKIDKQIFLDISNLGMKALFSDYTVREMSDISYRVIASTDFKEVAKRRNSNYDSLYSMLESVHQVRTLVKRENGMCPLGLIISVEDRDGLFKHLIANGVYCNIHWRPNESTAEFEDSSWLADHCITLPCDQRYGEREMIYIFETIKTYFE